LRSQSESKRATPAEIIAKSHDEENMLNLEKINSKLNIKSEKPESAIKSKEELTPKPKKRVTIQLKSPQPAESVKKVNMAKFEDFLNISELKIFTLLE
jgi:hypothetical protein